jgi:hypothetical protein
MPTAQDISASTLNDLQIKIGDMYTGTTPSKMPWVDHLGTATAMLENNGGIASEPMRNENGECIGTYVKWLKYGTDDITYSGTGSGLDLSCNLGTGSGQVSATQTYANNLVIYDLQVVKDNECSNVFSFQDLSANAIARAMHKNRKALNAQMVTFLDGRKSAVNNDADVTAGNVDGVSFAASTFDVSSTVLPFNDPDSLTVLDAIVQNNSMETAFWVAGRNAFYNALINAEYRRLNDNERYLARFDDYNMFFDIKNLDSTLTGKNLFAVSPNSYIFWNAEVYASTQFEQIDYDKWVALMPDPVLRYNDNGTLRPMMHNIVYQRVCSDRNNSTLKHQMNHVYEVRLQGGIAGAPPSDDNHTGVLKFMSV